MAAPKQKIVGLIKLQIPAGKATPAPPVGPALGQHGVNIVDFTKQFNDKTANQQGMIIPTVITVYADRSFTFITKTPPAATLILKELGIKKGSGVPNKDKVAQLTMEQVRRIAETKMPDLNASSVEVAMTMIEGTARSMGVTVEGIAVRELTPEEIAADKAKAKAKAEEAAEEAAKEAAKEAAATEAPAEGATEA